MRVLAVLFALGCFALSCSAQEWEFGGAFGYGIYRHASIISPGGKASAGIRDRFVAGAVFTENMYTHVAGEIRYTYHDGDPFISAGGVKTNLQGQSHSFTYELLFLAGQSDSRIRPFVAAGGGAKLYVVSGPENPIQPLSNVGVLHSIDQWKTLASVGGGVKFRMQEHVVLRVDFRDYITTFPRKQIEPAPFGTARGLFQQFTPMVGISYAF